MLSTAVLPVGRTDSDVESSPAPRRQRRQRQKRPPVTPVPASSTERLSAVQGLVFLPERGPGKLRVRGYLPHPDDVLIPEHLARACRLRQGDTLRGEATTGRQGAVLREVTHIHGHDPLQQRPHFEKLTPVHPTERLRLETGQHHLTGRIIDLVAPLGKGQRGLIVSPPKAGKTLLLQEIARSLTENNPEVHLMVVLVDERPEEVTDMQRSIQGEVIASTFDQSPREHKEILELAIERAKRLVEEGEDVVVLLDSLTRVGRAYNMLAPSNGRVLSGGMDAGALSVPKRLFGAARSAEEGGSLTILATALIETGSRMDEVIFEEFKGTGNMEIRLDRHLAQRRLYPAIDITGSGTRKEENLLSPEEQTATTLLRRGVGKKDGTGVLESLLGCLPQSTTNREFLRSLRALPQ